MVARICVGSAPPHLTQGADQVPPPPDTGTSAPARKAAAAQAAAGLWTARPRAPRGEEMDNCRISNQFYFI